MIIGPRVYMDIQIKKAILAEQAKNATPAQ